MTAPLSIGELLAVLALAITHLGSAHPLTVRLRDMYDRAPRPEGDRNA